MGRRSLGSLTVISYKRAARRCPLQQRARWLEALFDVAEGQDTGIDSAQRRAAVVAYRTEAQIGR